MTTLGTLTTSPIGFGCMALTHIYGGTTDDAARRTLDESIDAGITLLDTADVYGAPHEGASGPVGTNEEMLAPLLARRRQDVQLATKFGITSDVANPRGDPAYVRECCEQSLQRLGVDCIDLYYVHR